MSHPCHTTSRHPGAGDSPRSGRREPWNDSPVAKRGSGWTSDSGLFDCRAATLECGSVLPLSRRLEERGAPGSNEAPPPHGREPGSRAVAGSKRKRASALQRGGTCRRMGRLNFTPGDTCFRFWSGSGRSRPLPRFPSNGSRSRARTGVSSDGSKLPRQSGGKPSAQRAPDSKVAPRQSNAPAQRAARA
jgi:hypothetical protein